MEAGFPERVNQTLQPVSMNLTRSGGTTNLGIFSVVPQNWLRSWFFHSSFFRDGEGFFGRRLRYSPGLYNYYGWVYQVVPRHYSGATECWTLVIESENYKPTKGEI